MIKDFDKALTVLARFPVAGRARFARIGLRAYPGMIALMNVVIEDVRELGQNGVGKTRTALAIGDVLVTLSVRETENDR